MAFSISEYKVDALNSTQSFANEEKYFGDVRSFLFLQWVRKVRFTNGQQISDTAPSDRRLCSMYTHLRLYISYQYDRILLLVTTARPRKTGPQKDTLRFRSERTVTYLVVTWAFNQNRKRYIKSAPCSADLKWAFVNMVNTGKSLTTRKSLKIRSTNNLTPELDVLCQKQYRKIKMPYSFSKIALWITIYSPYLLCRGYLNMFLNVKYKLYFINSD